MDRADPGTAVSHTCTTWSLRGMRPSAQTHRVCGELGRVIVDISDPDEGGGRVGQAVGGVSLHVGGLDDQGVLGDFLEMGKKGNAQWTQGGDNI